MVHLDTQLRALLAREVSVLTQKRDAQREQQGLAGRRVGAAVGDGVVAGRDQQQRLLLRGLVEDTSQVLCLRKHGHQNFGTNADLDHAGEEGGIVHE